MLEDLRLDGREGVRLQVLFEVQLQRGREGGKEAARSLEFADEGRGE